MSLKNFPEKSLNQLKMNTPGEIDVIGLGQACFDCLGTVPCYPPEDSKIEMDEVYFQVGGPVAVALITLSQLGVSSSFIGSISDDYFGVEILKGLKNEDIDTSFLKITSGFSSQFAFISINNKQGNRNIYWRRSTAPFIKPDEVDLKPLRNAKVLHLDGLMIESSIEAAKQAKEMGIKVVIDAGTMREGFLKLLPFADYLITSEKFARSVVNKDDYTHRRALEILKKHTTGDIVITLGSEGSIGLINDSVIFQKAYPIDAVNTNGAGDVYHGAYIFGIIKGWNGKECMGFASAASAIKCEHIEYRKDLLSVKKVKIFMDKYAHIL
ncbi:carbohydrate kinase family protein [Thermodesulfobacteriota bacterium]